MKNFLRLIDKLDSTTSTKDKVEAIAEYFREASAADSAWALFFLSGQRLKKMLGAQKMRQWCQEEMEIADWLFEESYAHVGDTAELIALLVKQTNFDPTESLSLDELMQKTIIPLKSLAEDEQKKVVVSLWRSQNFLERFVLNKLLTGAFRLGVSFIITVRGLSKATGIPTSTLSVRLAGDWAPSANFFASLISEEGTSMADVLQPFPFYLASPFEGELDKLGNPEDWTVEWKWDGIRAQIISKNGKMAIWSRGKELITQSFPDLLNAHLEGNSFVLDGEILAFKEGKPLPFADLQKRLGRKNVTLAIQESYPVAFMIYDLLEWNGKDFRHVPFIKRRKKLEELFSGNHFHPSWNISPSLKFETWSEVIELRKQSESNLTEGVMIKKNDSNYGVGRQKGYWWKFKIDTMNVDAVLLYAQPGSGYRSGLYTDYTFAVWKDKELVPIAKAYSGLNQEEILKLDRWIRKHTVEKFGPVRRVEPFHVFEIAFENIQVSNRHKSGLALRFPRIKRWRDDKAIEEADTLESLQELLKKRSTYGY